MVKIRRLITLNTASDYGESLGFQKKQPVGLLVVPQVEKSRRHCGASGENSTSLWRSAQMQEPNMFCACMFYKWLFNFQL